MDNVADRISKRLGNYKCENQLSFEDLGYYFIQNKPIPSQKENEKINEIDVMEM